MLIFEGYGPKKKNPKLNFDLFKYYQWFYTKGGCTRSVGLIEGKSMSKSQIKYAQAKSHSNLVFLTRT